MSKTAAEIEQDVLDILNRTDSSSTALAELAVTSAHQKLQGFRDWDAQKTTYRRLANFTYSFTRPSAFKAPRQLFKVSGTDLTSDLIPALPSTDSLSVTPFYRRTSMEEVLYQRAVLQAQTNNSATPNSILTQERLYTIDGTSVEITPSAGNDSSNQIALTHYAMLDYPSSSDWFTDNGFEYLTLEALIWMVNALGEVDERIAGWSRLASAALNKVIGLDVGLDIGGDQLVMRG